MRGQKYNDDIREKAIAMMAVNNNAAFVARELGIARSTVVSWVLSADKNADDKENKTFAEIRAKKKEKFINEAWDNIMTSLEIIRRRLTRAGEIENRLEKLVDNITSAQIDDKERTAAIQELCSLHIEDIGDIAKILSTLYDKQALACKESTAIINGSVNITRFEDL